MVKATLYLLHYNNYYNRQVKKEANLSDYLRYQIGFPIQGVNFIPNDFINTTQIVNWNNANPDYVVIVDEENNINSRWFVISSNRTRANQLNLQLRRDLVVDYWEDISSPNTSIFVEKATLPWTNDLIFNSENMTYNQIKKSELLLKDKTGCPWICIYAAQRTRNDSGQVIDTVFEDEFKTYIDPTYTFTQEEWDSKEISKIATSTKKWVDFGVNKTFMIGLYGTNNQAWNTEGNVDDLSLTAPTFTSISSSSTGVFKSGLTSEYMKNVINEIAVDLYNAAVLQTSNKTLEEEITLYGDKTLKIGDKYYILNVDSRDSGLDQLYSLSMAGSPINIVNNISDKVWENPSAISTTWADAIYVKKRVSLQLIELSDIQEVTYKYRVDDRLHVKDAPYDIFCMPYSDTFKTKTSVASKFMALNIARSFTTKYSGTNQVYDIQLLPYCPLPYDVVDGGFNPSDEKATTPIIQLNGNAQTIVGYIFHAQASSFKNIINLENPISIKDYKIESECDMYRLCSPNYASAFEFNAAKNNGVEYFNIACTYKPFNPYIKVYPNFKRMYGNDFNDARGLILAGDYSLPSMSDSWQTYELQNKNYNLAFERQIQSMDFNNSMALTGDIVNSITGTLSGAVSGAAAGSILGPVGALAGGAIGGVLSAAGGITDVTINNQLREEAKDLTKDLFGYNLGNIKALPQTITKVSAYNIDNKYFPFLEYYTCSDVEKKALSDKIKYNGMTVMTIGSLYEYINTYTGSDPMYFKGKLIRLSTSNDYHVTSAIADEIYKGVFI